MIRRLLPTLLLLAGTASYGAEQVINVGAAVNDGTGDTGRVAFQKAQANFDEIYGGIPPGIIPMWVSSQTLTAPSTFTLGTANQNLLGINSTVTGTVGNAVSFAPAYMKFTFTNFTKSVAPTFVPGFEVNTVFGGSGDLGSFSGALISTAQTATTGNKAAGYSAAYVGGIFTSSGSATEGGTNAVGGAYGSIWGIDTVSTLTSGATNWVGIRGIEADIKLGTGATAREKTGFLAILESSDDADASTENTAYFAGKAMTATSGGWWVAYQVGDYNGVFPMASTGTIMGCYTHAAAGGACGTTTNGIDFVGGSQGLGQVTFTGYAFRSTGFSVDGSGNLSALTLALTPGSAISQASWGTSGIGLTVPAATYNDTTTGSGGVTTEAAYAFGAPTVTNTQGTANTLTNLVNLYLTAPVCGSGWTACTNSYALYALGKIFTSGSFTGTAGAIINGGTISLNNNSNGAVSIGTGTNNLSTTLGGTTAGNIVNLASVSNRVGNVLYSSVTAPTINAHFNTSSDTIIAASTAAFQVTVGTGAGTSTGSVTMPTASNGWSCSVADVTTPATNMVQQTGSTTTSVTVTNYVRTTGVAGNFTNSDKLNFICGAF